nr:hypothetical protein [Pseudomonadales bacterium]
LRAHPNVNGEMSNILHKIRRHQALRLELESFELNASVDVDSRGRSMASSFLGVAAALREIPAC